MSPRLPTTITPVHYSLSLSSVSLSPPFLYVGTVSIELSFDKDEDKDHDNHDDITLHCLDVSIDSAVLSSESESSSSPSSSSSSSSSSPSSSSSSSPSLRPTSISYSLPHQTATLTFPPFLLLPFLTSSPRPTLTLSFRGRLNDQMRGFYRSRYSPSPSHVGPPRYMACTQHEPTDCRRFFPCFDEPSMKATFQTTVVVPEGRTAVSNTNVVSEVRLEGGGRRVEFGRTPRMSTYLHALVIGEFDCISKSNPSSNVMTTVYTMPGISSQGRFCLETADKCLEYQAGQFGVKYPLPKSDLLAIPDFAAGAMENWGCVTYREAKILTKAGETSLPMYKGIARTVCHELAHQWFGNLVTMDWWDGLFLNEGFARFMEFRSVDHIYPGWKIWEEFVGGVYNVALSLDALSTSHPVFVPVSHPDEINSIFDAISYAKGASLLRMASAYVGDEVFMEGVREYLRRHEYGNTVPGDLWGAIEEVSGKPVVGLMDGWTKQVGYPVLTVGEDLAITQERFLAKGKGKGNQKNDRDDPTTFVWTCPVSVVTSSGGTTEPSLLQSRSDDQLLPNLLSASDSSGSSTWFKVNVSETGFYVVNYTDSQWSRLSSAVLPGGALGSIDRLGLVSDCFRLARAGYTGMANALRLVEGLGGVEGVDQFVVWEEVAKNVVAEVEIAGGTEWEGRLKEWTRELFRRQFEGLGWDKKSGADAKEEDANLATFRATALKMLMVSGDAAVIEEGARRFRSYVENGTPIEPDLVEVVYRMALRHDESRCYSDLKELYRKTAFPEEQRRTLMAMGSVQDGSRWDDCVRFVLYSGEVRLQDVAFPLSRLGSSSGEAATRAWNYLRDNYEELEERFADGQMWPSIVSQMVSYGDEEKRAQEIGRFFETHEPGSAKKRIEQGLEKIRIRAKRKVRENESLKAFFDRK